MNPLVLFSSIDRVRCRFGQHASSMDMLRSETRVIVAIGPANFGGIGRVSERLRTLASLGPAARLGLRATPRSRRWAYRPDLIDEDVTEVPAFPLHELDRVLTELSRSSSPEIPFRARLAGDYLLLDISHGLCDALLPLEVIGYLADPRPEAPLPRWATQDVTVHPLLPTLASWVVSHPRKVLDMVYGRIRPGKAGAFVAPAVGATVGPATHGDTTPWHRSPTVVAASSAVGFVDRIRQWRKDVGETASVSAIISTAVATSLARSGIRLSNSVTFLFDCRRYLPADAVVLGNFAAGLDFPSTDPTSRDQVQFALTSAIDKGRPIAAATLSSLKYQRTGSASGSTVGDRVDADPSAELIFSDLGRVRSLETVSWLSGETDRVFYGLSEPSRPESIVITTQQLGTVMYISASFHDNAFDPATVKAALDAVASSPLDLVTAQETPS
ncbi:hypothetical protein CH275_18670 [Rhodococcus sp. 06-235-1A]|uniref:hypothetical protein n=1 Tax=Rhodococcus sp. 06-235-1A TaxID=2022508 RepID=UPI000B9B20DB|nr:hypothetical protein [Rhodococcus sp. 06-235-1A]OZD01820.1 hypothetical protein CH275_18670 [Rhodococcus sp. 06-235-1A]